MSNRLAQLRTLAQADPKDADVPYMIAQELAKQGDLAGSLEAYDNCLALDDHYHYARYHKARALMALDRLDDARALVREAIPIAQRAGDGKATNELSALLAELE